MPASMVPSLGRTPIRVKLDTTVPGFEDIPLAAWSGTILDVDHGSNPPGYLVKWRESAGS